MKRRSFIMGALGLMVPAPPPMIFLPPRGGWLQFPKGNAVRIYDRNGCVLADFQMEVSPAQYGSTVAMANGLILTTGKARRFDVFQDSAHVYCGRIGTPEYPRDMTLNTDDFFTGDHLHINMLIRKD